MPNQEDRSNPSNSTMVSHAGELKQFLRDANTSKLFVFVVKRNCNALTRDGATFALQSFVVALQVLGDPDDLP